MVCQYRYCKNRRAACTAPFIKSDGSSQPVDDQYASEKLDMVGRHTQEDMFSYQPPYIRHDAADTRRRPLYGIEIAWTLQCQDYADICKNC